jgi:hypothetical protein
VTLLTMARPAYRSRSRQGSRPKFVFTTPDVKNVLRE